MKRGFYRASVGGRFFYLFFFLILFSLDFFSKKWIYDHFFSQSLADFSGDRIVVFRHVLGIDCLITPLLNRGTAWGFFSSWPQQILVIRIGLIALLFFYITFVHRKERGMLPLLLILTGAIGNVVDTLFYGFVIDFFHLVFWGYSYPVFNVADSLIFIGTFFLIFQMGKEKKKKADVY